MSESAQRRALRGHRIAMFSTADWDTLLPTNKHHLARMLARNNRVLFIETLGTRAPQLGSGADLTRILRRLRRGFEGPVKRAKNLWSVAPLVRPNWSTPTAVALNRTAYHVSAGRHATSFVRDIAWVYSPYAIHLLSGVAPRALVYHMVDDLASVPGANAEALRDAEAQLLSRADIVFCTERSLFERAHAEVQRGRAVLMENVADFAHFSTPLDSVRESTAAKARFLGTPQPRAVFSGHLASHKVDVALLDSLAAGAPDIHFVFIGPVWERDPLRDRFEKLARHRNVTMLGHVPYAELPFYLQRADVLLVPYALTEATRAVFPLKLFEYFATGRPVVASAEVPSLEPFGAVVHLVRNDPASWAAAIRRSVGEVQGASQRRTLARRHTWETRLAEMEVHLLEVLERRR